MEKYQINYHENITLDQFIMSDGTIKYKDIRMKQALILIQANIILYYSQIHGQDRNITVIENQLEIWYQNYAENVYPIIEEIESPSEEQQVSMFLLFITFFGVLWAVFSICWIYYMLQIKQKIYSILIWFLDIPLDYVCFLHKKCLYFIKNYNLVKDITDKRIKLHEQVHYVDEYKGLAGEKTEDSSEEQLFKGQSEENQINNNRKILVTRYRK